jgi:hypothetical protein
MKIILSSIILLLILSTNLLAQTGQATIFSYDASGQRVLRYVEPNAVLNKFGDTLNQNSPPDTIKSGPSRQISDHIVIKAYPNPATDEIIVENLSWQDASRAVVKIFDIAGKLIQSNSVNTARKQFSISSVTPGTYNVHYYLNEKLLTTWKIIKR